MFMLVHLINVNTSFDFKSVLINVEINILINKYLMVHI